MNMIEAYASSHTTKCDVSSSSSHSVYENIKIPKSEIKDSISFQEMSYHVNFVDEESNTLTDVYKGEINNKNAKFKVVSQPYNKKDSEMVTYVNGTIGNNKFSYTETIPILKNRAESNTNRYIEGKYNNKNFSLHMEISETDKNSKIRDFINNKILGRVPTIETVKITGTYDNNEINIEYPNSKVSKDSDLRDIISIISSDAGIDYGINEGNVISVGYDINAYKFYSHRDEQRKEFFNENVKPYIVQVCTILVTAAASFIAAKLGGNANNPPSQPPTP